MRISDWSSDVCSSDLEAARQWLTAREDKLREAAAALKTSPDEVPARVASLVEERRRLERELADAKKQLAIGGGGSAGAETESGPEQVGGHAFIGQVIEGQTGRESCREGVCTNV